jgi:hypothetical protein
MTDAGITAQIHRKHPFTHIAGRHTHTHTHTHTQTPKNTKKERALSQHLLASFQSRALGAVTRPHIKVLIMVVRVDCPDTHANNQSLQTTLPTRHIILTLSATLLTHILIHLVILHACKTMIPCASRMHVIFFVTP